MEYQVGNTCRWGWKCMLALVFSTVYLNSMLFNDLRSSNDTTIVEHNEKKLPSSNFELAYSQSNGFFDDISNSMWERAQEIHYKLFPNHSEDLKQYSMGIKDNRRDTSHRWNGQNFNPEFHCPLAQRIPTDNPGDGPKWVCDPHRLRGKKDCLVYSVGSNGRPEFEQGVKDEIGSNCEIHTFDLVNYNRRNGDFATALQNISTFHYWGLGTQKQASSNPKTFKTLNQTMNELGHAGRTIDIFKIDCEHCEWDVFEDWLQQDMRQILVETHNAPYPNAPNLFFALHDAGYVIFNKEANYYTGGEAVEFGFIKLSADFFINGSMYNKTLE